MSSAGPLGSSDAPTLASLIPLVASISPELESEKMANLQLCSSFSDPRNGQGSHPFKKKKRITEGLRASTKGRLLCPL